MALKIHSNLVTRILILASCSKAWTIKSTANLLEQNPSNQTKMTSPHWQSNNRELISLLRMVQNRLEKSLLTNLLQQVSSNSQIGENSSVVEEIVMKSFLILRRSLRSSIKVSLKTRELNLHYQEEIILSSMTNRTIMMIHSSTMRLIRESTIKSIRLQLRNLSPFHQQLNNPLHP